MRGGQRERLRNIRNMRGSSANSKEATKKVCIGVITSSAERREKRIEDEIRHYA